MINKILVLLALSTFNVNGQDFSKEFGKISKDEIELKEYALDKDAEAVVLFDLGKSYFEETDNSFVVVFEKTTRIKILSDAGVKWAEVKIPYYREGEIYENVLELEATSYNFENGRLIKSEFNVTNSFDEKINGNWIIKKFAVPNVKAGSVIEYRYKIYSQYKFNFRDWEFQWKIPVIYSEYVVKMIPFYEYSFILQGANIFDVYESYKDQGMPRTIGSPGAYGDNTYSDMVYKYGMKNVPAFKDEEFVSSINDYIIKLDFQLSKFHDLYGGVNEVVTTWQELIKRLLNHKDFGNYVTKSKKIASKILDIESISQKTQNEKFNTVLDYVKSNYNWNNHQDKFASKNPQDLVTDKIGNCADLNLFTIGMLNSLDIEAYPVIISTREHGKLKLDYPFLIFFDYVIILAYVDGNIVLADATETLSLNNRIPTRCINDKGLIIKKDKVEWIGLECLFASNTSTFFTVKINDKDMSVNLSKAGTEYDALYFRNTYTDNIDVVKEKISINNYSIADSTIFIQNHLNKQKTYKLSYSFTTKLDIINNKIYVSPFFKELISDNPFKQKERKYPIDMIYPQKKSFYSTIIIPEGYKIEYLPSKQNIDNELFELTYSASSDGSQIIVFFDYYFKKSVYPSDDYSNIKFYFNEIVNKGNEKIVLSKI